MANKTNVLVGFLLLVIVVLGGVLVYLFVIQPAVTGYTVDRQTEGYQFAILSVMQNAASCQPVPLTYGEQTINLIALECPQIQQILQQAQTQASETNPEKEIEVNLEG